MAGRRPRPEILARGIDSVYVTLTGDLLPEHEQQLMETQAEARERRNPLPLKGWLWKDGGSFWEPVIRPFGHQHYSYAVVTPDWELSMGRLKAGEVTGMLQIRSEYLWQRGPAAIQAATNWASNLMGSTKDDMELNRVDQAVDMQGFAFRVGDLERFTCRAETRDEWPDRVPEPKESGSSGFFRVVHRGRDLGTLYFGAPGSPMQSRTYRKDWQMENRPKAAWYSKLIKDLGWDGEKPLQRVEFQYRRDHLKRMGITKPWELNDGAGDLWKDATKWMRFRSASGGVVRNRKEVDWWDSLSTVWSDKEMGLLRHTVDRTPQVEHLTDQVLGLLATIASAKGWDREDALCRLPGLLEEREQLRGIDLNERIAEKAASAGRVLADIKKATAEVAVG